MRPEGNHPSGLWSFHNPVTVRFGRGKRDSLASDIQGQRILAISTERGRQQFLGDPVLGALKNQMVWVDSVTPNPGLDDIHAAFSTLTGQDFDAVLAFGGGSAMDFAKAIASLLAPGNSPTELRGLISEPGTLLASPPLPIIALPTTSGTGSEVTPFATVWDHVNRKKLSLASPTLFPRIAIVDPELTDTLPASSTLSSGLDALNQAFESVWNRNRSPVTVGLAARAISLALKALPRLHTDIDDHSARDELAEASLLAGLCISQTRTAICHSISYPLTAHFGISHGVACAFTMGEVFAVCVDQQPELFDTVTAHTGHETATELVIDVKKLLASLRVGEAVSRSIGSVDRLTDLTNQMMTPGRSDNFVLQVDERFIARLITASYR